MSADAPRHRVTLLKVDGTVETFVKNEHGEYEPCEPSPEQKAVNKRWRARLDVVLAKRDAPGIPSAEASTGPDYRESSDPRYRPLRRPKKEKKTMIVKSSSEAGWERITKARTLQDQEWLIRKFAEQESSRTKERADLIESRVWLQLSECNSVAPDDKSGRTASIEKRIALHGQLRNARVAEEAQVVKTMHDYDAEDVHKALMESAREDDEDDEDEEDDDGELEGDRMRGERKKKCACKVLVGKRSAVCSECGAVVSRDSRFCSDCGAELS